MIPDEFNDLPVHPLAVHGAVVLVPLATVLAILFVIPRTRAWAALPLVIVSLVALLNLFVARESGFNLKNNLGLGEVMDDHLHKASLLLWFMLFFTIIALVVYFLYRQGDKLTGAVEYVACGVLIVGALVVAWQSYQTGEAGSKVVWGGQSASGPVSQHLTTSR